MVDTDTSPVCPFCEMPMIKNWFIDALGDSMLCFICDCEGFLTMELESGLSGANHDDFEIEVDNE